MAVIKGGASSNQVAVGTNLAARVEVFDADGLPVNGKKTYMASASFTPPATPQDLAFIIGSATKTVKVQSFRIGTANTAAGSQIFFLKKTTTAATGGTAVNPTAVACDSSDAAATAVVTHITTSANTPGTGTVVRTIKVGTPAVTPATWAGINTTDNDVEMLPTVNGQTKAITLRGILEGLAINFAGTALVAGQIHTYNVVWTEE